MSDFRKCGFARSLDQAYCSPSRRTNLRRRAMCAFNPNPEVSDYSYRCPNRHDPLASESGCERAKSSTLVRIVAINSCGHAQSNRSSLPDYSIGPTTHSTCADIAACKRYLCERACYCQSTPRMGAAVRRTGPHRCCDHESMRVRRSAASARPRALPNTYACAFCSSSITNRHMARLTPWLLNPRNCVAQGINEAGAHQHMHGATAMGA